MKYNMENTAWAGRLVERIVDANGLEWDCVIECDTETGEIVRYQTDDQGGFVLGMDGYMLRETIQTAAPLVVTFTPTEKIIP